ncbi:MAG TPA: helix-turn-helix domain-containing protein [Streptosporangiaceae bacterium]|nr:helix-turn-helix domain-containing protein [Streptosporangiaceae bacterium]
MNPEPDLAAVASLMADRHRAQILLALLGGAPQSGSALAEATGISRALASAHLKKLVAGGLVTAERTGRHQLYSIASEPVADALETLILLAPAGQVRSLKDSVRARDLRWARMCYDHLAGAVGVAVADALTERDLIREHDGGYQLGPSGIADFGEFGINVGELQQRSRPLARPCVDWSERRNHLAGSLGAAVTTTMISQDWLRRRDRTRIVTITEAGEAGLRSWLGLDLTALRAAG